MDQRLRSRNSKRSAQVRQPVFVLNFPPCFVRILLAGARGAETPYMTSVE